MAHERSSSRRSRKGNYYPYLEYFKGREDYIACQGKDYYYPIQAILTPDHLRKHLDNLATFGIYVLTSDSKCNFICLDIDIPQNELHKLDFRNPTQKYRYLKNKLVPILDLLNNNFSIPQESILVEDTGGRGYHIWLFFSHPVQGKDAIKFHLITKSFINFDFEFFPKQPNLTKARKFGNLIKLPLGTHQKYESRSSFLKLEGDRVQLIASVEDNLKHLSTIQKIDPRDFNKIIHEHEQYIDKAKLPILLPEHYRPIERPLFRKDLDFLFEHCTALKKLNDKAEAGVQFSYKEAFHLANLLLSVDDTYDFLLEKLRKSFQSKFNLDISQKEIQKIVPLYPSSCKTLIDHGICDGFCTNDIKNTNIDPLLPNTNPLHVWLLSTGRKISIPKEEILPRIADPTNIIDAYWKLKEYHKNEDVGFYDQFDFEFFERNLEVNSRYLSKALANKENIPLLGYIKVNTPKKVNENGEIQYRQLAYSTIYDQVVIQALFNIIAHFLEPNFQKYSFGYRCDITDLQSDHIFHDWREYYPIFRNRVLTHLRRPNIKYYICCDIKGYYDNIDHGILLEQLKRYFYDDYVSPLVEKVIRAYEFKDGTGKGIPQGPAYARILANLYLNEFDKEIANHSAGYFRYVDDFFLFYETRHEAEQGLAKVYNLLNDLWLTLSIEEKKKPEIKDKTDEGIIISKLDSIRYGIFEEFKFIDSLDVVQINDFYDAIERHEASPATFGELIEINNNLPSIIYLLSKNIPFLHSIKNKILAIINYLVENELFCPKRLKYIFYTIINLMVEFNQSIPGFYSKLHSAHKIYFLLTLYGMYKSNNSFREELSIILKKNLLEHDAFIKGFSIAISNDLGINETIGIQDASFLEQILHSEGHFSKLKLFSVINYFNLGSEKKAIIRRATSSQISYLEKKFLFSKLEQLRPEYVDSLFLENLLQSNTHFLLPECCSLFASLRDDSSLFRKLEKFISAQVNYKEVSISYLNTLIFERYKYAGLAELDNLVDLYNKITDDEIRRELLDSVQGIRNRSGFSGDSFSKDHMLVRKYNGCFYFKNVRELDQKYQFIELIPRLKLSEYEYLDLDDLRNDLLDMAYNRILPALDFEYDSKQKQASIKYILTPQCKDLHAIPFNLTKSDIFLALELMDNLYKKARYFFLKFKQIPCMTKENLLVDLETKEVLFKTFGSILIPIYVLPQHDTIRTDFENEIPRMISSLLKDLFFEADIHKTTAFLGKSSMIGIELFLSHFVKRLSEKDAHSRYSYSRFHYIFNQLKATNLDSDYEITNLYFNERLKARLSDRNQDTLNWLSVCNALADLYAEMARIYDLIDFTRIAFTNRTFLNFGLPAKLHHLSNQILQICLNIDNILLHCTPRTKFVTLFELLNYFALFCIELISFFKVGCRALTQHPPLLPDDVTALFAYGYEQQVNLDDINIINTLIEKDLNQQDIFGPSFNFTLKQIAILYLLKSFSYETDRKHLVIKNHSTLNQSSSALLAYNLLIRLPTIETQINKLIHNVMMDLAANQDFSISPNDLKIRDDILNICKFINRIRGKLQYKRYFGHRTKLDRWPPKIYCKRLVRSKYEATEKALSKIPLSNQFPSSGSKCSWDMLNGNIYNLVVPNERINKVISLFTKGKVFGFKITYLYSEKAKVFWDIGLIFLMLVFTVVLDKLYDTSARTIIKGIYFGGKTIFEGGFLFFVVKLFYDIRYWSNKLYKIIEYIRK